MQIDAQQMDDVAVQPSRLAMAFIDFSSGSSDDEDFEISDTPVQQNNDVVPRRSARFQGVNHSTPKEPSKKKRGRPKKHRLPCDNEEDKKYWALESKNRQQSYRFHKAQLTYRQSKRQQSQYKQTVLQTLSWYSPHLQRAIATREHGFWVD